jgi:hypothetical protein
MIYNVIEANKVSHSYKDTPLKPSVEGWLFGISGLGVIGWVAPILPVRDY